MIHVQCHSKECSTPNFCIPPPNTFTSIVYVDNLNLKEDGVGGDSSSEASSSVQGGNTITEEKVILFGTGDNITGNDPSRESNLQEELAKLDMVKSLKCPGLATLNKIVSDDYLVVYCNEGHKNYIPFNR